MPESRWREMGGRVLGAILDIGCSVRYDIKVRGLDNYTRSPSTIAVFNHRRDADTPIIGNVLFARKGLFHRGVEPVFITREDMFRTGFLARYLEGSPPLFRAAVRPINLRPALWALRAYPMRRVAERTLREVLEDVLRIFGDLPLEQVLKPDWYQRFRQLAPESEQLSVSRALRPRFRALLRQDYGLTKLTRSQFRALKPYERAAIEAHLQSFTEMLEQGNTLQMAPEGAVSKDGRFARIRAGLHVLVNRPRVDVRVLPVGITYDFMTCNRAWVFLNVGQEMTGLRGLRPAELSARVSQAILAQSTITASQLASQLVLSIRSQGGGTFTRKRLTDFLIDEAGRWAASGIYVDPRLRTPEELEKRVDQYLEYCLKHGELFPRGDGRYWVADGVQELPASWADPGGAIKYTYNEFTSLAARVQVTAPGGT